MSMTDLMMKNHGLAERLRSEGLIVTQKVEAAFCDIRRDLFVPQRLSSMSFEDRPLPIGGGQTISAPHMVAIMSEELKISSGMKVLEIGTGSGYHAAITSRLVGIEGMVLTIERIHSLAAVARRNLYEAGVENVVVVEGDGSRGLADHAPFDRIYYTCGAPDVPGIVREQLKDGGAVLAPLGPKDGTQRLMRLTKVKDRFTEEGLTYCVFVPLIGDLGY